MKIEDCKRVLILGAGTMGHQISVLCAMNGFDVVIYDIDNEGLEKALKRMRSILDGFVMWKRITAEEVESIMKRVSTTTDAATASKGIDIVSESIPEDPALKGKVFAMFNKLCPEHTIFTTNTSTLLPSMFAEATGRPDRFAALHFHDIHMTDIVDIMPHPGTSKETVDFIKNFAEKIGQIPIMLHKENSGYVFNTMLSALFEAALKLAVRDVASVSDIDRAWMGVTKMLIGPFGLMDTVGLETVWKISDYWGKKTNDPQRLKNADFLKTYIDSGRRGMKSKKGFYDYPDPAYGKPDFIKKG